MIWMIVERIIWVIARYRKGIEEHACASSNETLCFRRFAAAFRSFPVEAHLYCSPNFSIAAEPQGEGGRWKAWDRPTI